MQNTGISAVRLSEHQITKISGRKQGKREREGKRKTGRERGGKRAEKVGRKERERKRIDIEEL